jgi:hypothetical protein
MFASARNPPGGRGDDTGKEVERVTMTMTAATGEVQVLPLSMTMAEVRLATGGAGTSIGKVSSRGGRWFWQHRDGEQSSPIAENRTAAANALAEYHRAFKQPPPAAPVRRLLFG